MSLRSTAAGRSTPDASSAADRQRPVYVVYPAALFDGWEVVAERDGERPHEEEPAFFDTLDEATSFAVTQAATTGGGIVKLENWFGDTEDRWEVPARAARGVVLAPR